MWRIPASVIPYPNLDAYSRVLHFQASRTRLRVTYVHIHKLIACLGLSFIQQEVSCISLSFSSPSENNRVMVCFNSSSEVWPSYQASCQPN